MSKETLAAGFWLLFSLCMSIASFRLGTGTGNRPGPGFFPFYAAVAIGIISLFRLRRTRREATTPTVGAPDGTGEWRKVLSVVASMLAYAVLLEPLGFVICTFLLMAFFLKFVAAQRWLTALSFAFAVALVAHVLFNVLLDADLPKGLLAL